MRIFMPLDFIALALAVIHFGTPLTYYFYLKNKYLSKPWNINADENYKPKVTIIIPTYNEAKLIEKKLNNIYKQKYPRDKLEVIVVDSASTDGTPKLIKKWADKHSELNLKLIVESERKGKAHALNHALEYATGEIVIITDVDSLWPSETITKTLKWFADPTVGAVSCLKKPVGSKVKEVEESYRQYYNILRIAESKAYATPIFHGELAAFRRNLLKKLGGFPIDIGADDSHTATKIALIRYRAIIPENLWVEELVPNKGYSRWRIRRAQHLIQHFAKCLRELRQAPKGFRKILAIETFLHLANPYLLLVSTILLIASTLTTHSLTALGILALGVALLIVKQYRTWIIQQLYLIVASLRNIWTKEIAWSKQVK